MSLNLFLSQTKVVTGRKCGAITQRFHAMNGGYLARESRPADLRLALALSTWNGESFADALYSHQELC
jgi:hypothetical protein